MKAMKKALALGLALAMVVTAVPVTSAQAASTAKLSASKVSVAAGTAKKQTKSVKVTTPSTWKSVKVKASSSDKKIATVKVSGKTVKVTAVKKGSAKVTVKVSAKKSGKTVKKTLTAKVKVINAGLRFVDPATEVVVGESVTLTAKKSPKAAVVTFKSSDDKIATVDADGKVTAVKAGKVTITATSDYGKEVTTDVTVKTAILKSAVQTKYNTISAVIAGDVSSIDPKNVVVTNTATKAVVAVKSVAKDPKDSTKTLITTFGSMTDGKDYTVAYDGTEVSFTATDAVVADVAVDPTTITAGSVGTKIYAQLLDKNGIVTEEWVYADANTPGKIEFTINSNKGYTSGDTLVLPEVGDTATAKVVYHTYQYDTTGAETGKLEKEVTITAVEDATTLSNYNYTISDKAAVNWNAAVAKNTSFAIGDSVKAFFYFKDSADNDVTKNYTVESSDTTVLLLDNTTLSSASAAYKGSDGTALTGIKAGTAYINVKNGAGKVVTSLPVTVKEERQLKSIKLGTNNVTLSASDHENNYAADVAVDGFDQYGDRYPVATALTTKVLSAPTGAGSPWRKGDAGNFDAVTDDENGHTTIHFDLAQKVGTYQVEVTVADKYKAWNTVKTVLTINGVRTDNVATPTYGIIVDHSSVDIAVDSYATKDDYVAPSVTAKVVEYKNGAITDTGLTADYTVLKPNKTQLSTTTGSSIGCTTALTRFADPVVTKNIPSWELGTYTVIGEYTPARGVKKTFTTSFTVKDSQDSAFADVKKTSDSTMPSAAGDKYDNAKTILCNSDLVEIYYDGAPLTLEAADFAGVVADGGNKDAVKLNGKLLYIGTVNVQVSTVGRLEVVVPVTINRTFTLN